jgi:hypothetical protein
MGYPEPVAIGFGLQFLHIALEIVAHQLRPMADVAADRFFQEPQLLACLFADEEPVMDEWILAEAATPGERPLPWRSRAIGESVNFHCKVRLSVSAVCRVARSRRGYRAPWCG